MIYRAYNHINDIADKWDGFLPIGHHLQSVHLKILEKSDLGNTAFYYLTFENDVKEIVGVGYFQWLHFTKEHYAFPLSKNIILKWIEERVMSRGFRILVCGNLLRINAAGLSFDQNKITTQEIFSLIEVFYKTLKPFPHAILIKDWPTENDIAWAVKFNYQKWQPDFTMKLNLRKDWKNIDDYVKSLRHRYSQRYRKKRLMLYPITRREILPEELPLLSRRIEQLYLNVVNRQSIRLLIVNQNYFTEMKTAFGERFRIVGYFNGSELVAFSSNIVHHDFWELHYIGLDYAVNKVHSLYFNILYDAVEDSIREGSLALELGRTARNTKELIGASPIYFNNYVRLKSGVVSGITFSLRRKFNKKNKAEEPKDSAPFRIIEVREKLIPKL